MIPVILASSSEARRKLLTQSDINVTYRDPRVDEVTIKEALVQQGIFPRDLADALAEAKAIKISEQEPDALVIGSDQVLEANGQIWSKPATKDLCIQQLKALSGQEHRLLTAAVIAQAGKPIWRTVGVSQLWMRRLDDASICSYVDRNWPGIGHTVGGYKIEEEGVRLFSRIDGDHFQILGLPLIEISNYLTDIGAIAL